MKITSVIDSEYDSFCFADALNKVDENFDHTDIVTRGNGSIANVHRYSSLLELENKISSTEPEIIMFWGNSPANNASVALKKKGYTIVHVGAGIRSGLRTTASEIDRTVCDVCSDYHFVYHDSHGRNLLRENFQKEGVFVIGNPAYQTDKDNLEKATKTKTPIWYKQRIILNITDPQNIYDNNRLTNLISYAFHCEQEFDLPITFLNSPEALSRCEEINLKLPFREKAEATNKFCNVVNDYIDFVLLVAQSRFTISDSEMLTYQAFTAGIQVVTPINQTSKSVEVNSLFSTLVNVDELFHSSWKESLDWVEQSKPKLDWFKTEDVAQNIVDSLNIIIKEKENENMHI